MRRLETKRRSITYQPRRLLCGHPMNRLHRARAGLETELNLINSEESRDAEFRVSVFDDRGQAILVSPDFILAPREQQLIDLSALFGLSTAELLTGSLEIEILNAFLGPYLVSRSINGSVRFKSLDGRYSVTIPLSGGRIRTLSTPMWHKIRASLPGWPSKIGEGLRLTGPWKRSMRRARWSGRRRLSARSRRPSGQTPF